MEEKERIKQITEFWFLTDPLLFAAYCTHELIQNDKMKIPFRTGKRRIEFNPEILKNLSDKLLYEYLKIEIIRILLKHPYQRLPAFPNRKVMTYASNITIADSYKTDLELPGVGLWPLPEGLCFEEYYNKVFAILSTPPDGNTTSGESIIPPEQPQNNDNDDTESDSGNTDTAETGSNPDNSNTGIPGSGNGNNQNAVEELSALWEEDEDICCEVNSLIEIAESSNTWGSISVNLQEIVKASRIIAMDYRKILSSFKTSIISSKRILTRMRPNRRFGFSFMGSRYDLTTNLLIAVDVSGSVSTRSLSQFFSIINSFFKNGIETLDVLQFDHELKTKEPLPFKKAKTEVKVIGRGGTSFQPAADYYCSHPKYDGLIYFTDGYAPPPVFNTKRNIDVLWILTSKESYNFSIKWVKKLARNRATYIPGI